MHSKNPMRGAIMSHYVATALWSSTDTDADGESFNLDDSHDASDVDAASLQSMRDDCAAFFFRARKILRAAGHVSHDENGAQVWPRYPNYDYRLAHAAHDFWLTRCGHGEGFWDGDWTEGDVLTELCKTFGNVDLYVGDDGRVYA